MLRARSHFLSLLIVVLAMAGCAGGQSTISGATVSPSLQFDLPSPATLGRRVESVQLVTAEVAGQKILFEARVSVASDRFKLVGTDPIGRRALTVEFVDGLYHAQKADWLPTFVDPNRVLADFILIFWPRAPLVQIFEGSGAELIDEGKMRTIRQNGIDLITIEYIRPGWRGHARLKNHIWDYVIDVRSAEVGR